MSTNPRLTTTQAKQNLHGILERVITNWARSCLDAGMGFEDVLGLAGSDDVSDQCYKVVETLEQHLRGVKLAMTKTPKNPNECVACGTLEHTTFLEAHKEILYPTCAARASLEDAANDHLMGLLEPIFKDWARFWQRAGMEPRQIINLAGNPDNLLDQACRWTEDTLTPKLEEKSHG